MVCILVWGGWEKKIMDNIYIVCPNKRVDDSSIISGQGALIYIMYHVVDFQTLFPALYVCSPTNNTHAWSVFSAIHNMKLQLWSDPGVCIYIYIYICCVRVSGFMFAPRCFNIQLLYIYRHVYMYTCYIVYKYRARAAVLELFILLVFVNYGLISRIFWWLQCIVQKLFPGVKQDKNVYYIIPTLFVPDKACPIANIIPPWYIIQLFTIFPGLINSKCVT